MFFLSYEIKTTFIKKLKKSSYSMEVNLLPGKKFYFESICGSGNIKI
jgi:hypothetical protein